MNSQAIEKDIEALVNLSDDVGPPTVVDPVNERWLDALVKLADDLAPPTDVDPVDARWLKSISSAPPTALVGLIARLDSGRGDTSRKRKAMREAAIAEAERRNSKAIIDTLHSLDKATTTLNKRMFWLAVAGVLLATAQVIFALTQ